MIPLPPTPTADFFLIYFHVDCRFLVCKCCKLIKSERRGHRQCSACSSEMQRFPKSNVNQENKFQFDFMEFVHQSSMHAILAHIEKEYLHSYMHIVSPLVLAWVAVCMHLCTYQYDLYGGCVRY